MYSCPSCGNAVVVGRTSCVCGADLTLLARIDGVADAWFNRGLEAAAAGSASRALEWFSAACAARPSDAGARQAQARVWAQLGHFEEARVALEQAAAIDPTLPDLASVRVAIEAGRQMPGAPRRRGREKKR